MQKKAIKVAITGAAGQIGYAMLPRIARGDMFGTDTEVELHLLELPAALPSLQGVAMELEDCAFPLLKNVLITDDLNVAMKDVNWAVLVGAMPRKAGMERSDLLAINGSIFTQQGKAINEHAANDVRVFVVGNPCNTNCLITMHHAPDIPKNRFYAMTLLDENRARAQLAKKVGASVDVIKNMVVWGNHSIKQYPDFYHATIDGIPATQMISEKWLQQTFMQSVQNRGGEVIKARGASSAASAANAAIRSIYKITHDTPMGESFSVASHSEGQYGVDEGLIFSFPSQVKNGRFDITIGWKHHDFGQQQLEAVIQELREEYKAVRDLKLITAQSTS